MAPKMDDKSNAKDEKEEPKPSEGRYNLRRSLSLKNWNFMKKRPDAKEPKKPVTNKKENKTALPALSNAQKIAIEKIQKQPTAPKKDSLKEKLKKSMSMSTPKKNPEAGTSSKRSVSPKMSPIPTVSSTKEAVEEIKMYPELENTEDLKKNEISPTKKIKASVSETVEIYPNDLHDELRRKIASIPKPSSVEAENTPFKMPIRPDIYKHNYINQPPEMREIIASRVPVPLRRTEVQKFVRNPSGGYNIVPITPKPRPPKRPELNSPLPDISETLSDSLELEQDFVGFEDGDIPDNIEDLEAILYDHQCDTPPKSPPPLVPQAAKVLVRRQTLATGNVPVAAVAASSSVPPLTRMAPKMIVSHLPILPSLPLKVIHEKGQASVIAKTPPTQNTKKDMETQTEPHIRNFNPGYLLVGEPQGSFLMYGSMTAIFDPQINGIKYNLSGINVNNFTVAQHHMAQLQLRHQLLSYQIFNDPKHGDYFPVCIVVNPIPESPMKYTPQQTNEVAVPFTDF